MSSTAADFYADSLTVTTTPPLESPYVTALHMTARGVVLSFNPASLAFGDVSVGGSSNKSFSVVNSGNVSANVTLTAATAGTFSVTPTTKSFNSSFNASAKFTSQNPKAPKTGTITIATTSATCGPLPAPLQLSGTSD